MNLRRFAVPVALALMAAFTLWGIGRVPFHPDETSLLYQSRDLEHLVTDPLSLAYIPGREPGLAAEYRALNAPLPKYTLGLGRRAAGFGPETVDTDWRWDLSWERNVDRGALPPGRALLGARLSSTLFVALGILLVYSIGLRIGGRPVGLVAAGLLSLNALVLVHGRRAMAEGTLIFAVGLAVLAAFDARHRPWLAGLAAAAAVGAKHSAAPLAVAGLLAAAGLLGGEREGMARRSALYLGSFSVGFFLINPFLWRSPLAGFTEIVSSRSGLVERQVAMTQALAPQGSLDQLSERLAAFIGHVFILPPQLQEVGNYASALQPSFQTYLSQPQHTLLRGLFLGGLLFTLFLVGLIFAGLQLRRCTSASSEAIWTLASATVLQALLLLGNPLPVQRYYVPLVPLVAVWQALAIVELVRAGVKALDTGDIRARR